MWGAAAAGVGRQWIFGAENLQQLEERGIDGYVPDSNWLAS